ncbi:DUF4430 domain-containing protein [Ornithinibacillus salinisoli]|uniref:DUF4430 domain-containing protein n=1 Tax=Ornithinibacillus salinisoli TaxID=1848459 RepID=A0ABW4VUU8_9BACI
MQKIIKKQLAVLFTVLLVVSNLVFLQPQTSYAATLENAVTIIALDEDGETVLPLTAMQIEEGDTAFDVLIQAGEEHNVEITYDEFDFGNMITGIGDAVQTDSLWWSFNVYGHGPDVGASGYEVENGEHILFTLTDNFTPSVPVTVSAIAEDGSTIIGETEVTLMEGASAYDALYQAAITNDKTLEIAVDNEYFTFIQNIGNTELETNDYWQVAVNEEPLMASIVAHQVQPEEHVQLTIQSYEDTGDGSTEDEKEETTDNVLPEITNKIIQDNISEITTYIANNNIAMEYGNEWWIWGIAHTDQGIPSSYVASVEHRVKELEGEFRNVFDLEKVIIGLSAAGTDATDVAGYNLVDKLVQHRSFENPSINMAIYGLLAIDSGDYQVSDEVRNLFIDLIMDKEYDVGGWALFGDRPTADITGMVLTALAPYQDRPAVSAAIERAVTYLSTEQDETGGYFEVFNGGDSSESVSQVITGLSSIGIDPTSDAFTKDGGNLVQHLLKFKQSDGGFSHIIDDDYSMGMSTQQAFLAFLAYQKFVLGDGKTVYQFTPSLDEEDTEDATDTEDETGNDVEKGSSDNEKETDDGTGKEENNEESSSDKQESEKNQEETGKEETVGKKLPHTATNTMNFLLFGFMLLLLGSTVLWLNRRTKA